MDDNDEKHKGIEVEGSTVEDAIEKAMEILSAPRDEIQVKIVSEEKKGLFGMKGAKPAKIKVEVELINGETNVFFLEQSLGNVHRPLSNQQLDDKFRDQAILALPSETVEALIERCWHIDELDDLGDLARATIPNGGD